MEKFVFNPIANKEPKGAIASGEYVKYTLKVWKFASSSDVKMVIHRDGEREYSVNMEKAFTDEKYDYYQIDLNFTEVGLYWYHFELKIDGEEKRLVRSENLDIIDSHIDSDYLQLVYAKDSEADKSFGRGIIYHIFVDRFRKSGTVKPREGLNLLKDWNTPVEKEYLDGKQVNINCYGGNLAGVIEKLPYLKSLNVSTIYLSPIFEANSSHKYDTADYSKIDSMFGTMDKFQQLIDKAKDMDINIILDGVFNHTGSDSIYFNRNGRYNTLGAFQSSESPYFSWYEFNNYPYDYNCWWGIQTLPQTRENSGFFDYIAGEKGIINKYMSMGLGGFRLDVVDELGSNFLSAICNATRKIKPDAMVIGEVWEDASCKIAYGERKPYFLGGYLDSVTNYPMKNSILEYIKTGNEQVMVNTINMIKDQYPRNIQNNLMNFLDTHDTKRAITYLGADMTSPEYSEYSNYILSEEEREKATKLLKLATILQYTVMGIPCVFYGDEAGMEGMADPYCRGAYPWGNEDKDLIEWYQKLGNLRNNDVFDNGDLNIKFAEDGVFIYERVKNNKKVIIAINRNEESAEFYLDRVMTDFFTGNPVTGKQTLSPNSALVLY